MVTDARREYMRQWKKNNPDKVREYAKRYYARARVKILERNREYRKECRDVIRIKGRMSAARRRKAARESNDTQ